MRHLSLLALLVPALALPAGAALTLADTMLTLGALPLGADLSDGSLVSILQVDLYYRSDGVAARATEVTLSIAEEPLGAEAAIIPDRVSFPITLDGRTGGSVHPDAEHVALVVRRLGEGAPGANLTILAYAAPNGNMQASTATLRLPLSPSSPSSSEAAPSVPLPAARDIEAAHTDAAPVPAVAVFVGGFGGAAAGLLALALRLKRGGL